MSHAQDSCTWFSSVCHPYKSSFCHIDSVCVLFGSCCQHGSLPALLVLCFSTGVPRNVRVPRMASKGSAESNQETGTKWHLQPLDAFSELCVQNVFAVEAPPKPCWWGKGSLPLLMNPFLALGLWPRISAFRASRVPPWCGFSGQSELLQRVLLQRKGWKHWSSGFTASGDSRRWHLFWSLAH